MTELEAMTKTHAHQQLEQLVDCFTSSIGLGIRNWLDDHLHHHAEKDIRAAITVGMGTAVAGYLVTVGELGAASANQRIAAVEAMCDRIRQQALNAEAEDRIRSSAS